MEDGSFGIKIQFIYASLVLHWPNILAVQSSKPEAEKAQVSLKYLTCDSLRTPEMS